MSKNYFMTTKLNQGSQTPGFEGWHPAGFQELLPHLLLITVIKCLEIRSFNGELVGKHAGHRPSRPGV